MNMVRIRFFKYWMTSNLNIYFKIAEEHIKIPIWKYNDKCYLTHNDEQVTDYAVDKSKTDGDLEVVNFTKCMPYILYLTFYKYEFEKSKEVIK